MVGCSLDRETLETMLEGMNLIAKQLAGVAGAVWVIERYRLLTSSHEPRAIHLRSLS